MQGSDAKMTVKLLFQFLPSVLVVFLGYKLQNLDTKRKKHEENMSEYLYNLTNCLVTTVDSVVDIAEQVEKPKSNEDLKNAMATLKQSQRDLTKFQQRMAAKLISGG